MDDETGMLIENQPAIMQKGRHAKRARKFAILVAGMHRSGTSAVARTLSLLGCDLPKTLMSSGIGNEAGHWESSPIMALNDKVLASAGSVWDDWEAVNPDWYMSPVKHEFTERAQDALASEFGASRMFILKDPRICRLLPFWLEVLQMFGAEPLIVCPIRNPLDVAASLEMRDGMDPSIGQLLWLRHVIDAEVYSRSIKRAFVRYDDFLEQWQGVTKELSDDWGIAWPRQSTVVDVEIDSFLGKAHRHHAADDGRLLGNPRISQWIKSCFEILDRWAHGDIRVSDTDNLDRIKSAFDEAAPAFARPIARGRTAILGKAALEMELAAAFGRCFDLDQTVIARDAELAQSRAQISELESAAAKRQADLNATIARTLELEDAVRARDAELAGNEDRVGRLEEVLASSEIELGLRATRIDELQVIVAEHVAELIATRTRANQFEMTAVARDGELNLKAARIVQLEHLAAMRQTELSENNERLVDLEDRMAGFDQTVAEKNNEIAGLQSAVSGREAQLAKLQATISTLRRSTSWRVTAPLRGGEASCRPTALQLLRLSSDAQLARFLDHVAGTVARLESRARYRPFRAF